MPDIHTEKSHKSVERLLFSSGRREDLSAQDHSLPACPWFVLSLQILHPVRQFPPKAQQSPGKDEASEVSHTAFLKEGKLRPRATQQDGDWCDVLELGLWLQDQVKPAWRKQEAKITCIGSL